MSYDLPMLVDSIEKMSIKEETFNVKIQNNPENLQLKQKLTLSKRVVTMQCDHLIIGRICFRAFFHSGKGQSLNGKPLSYLPKGSMF